MHATTPPPEISAQLQQALLLLQRHLGATLHAVHLFGSAVDGGLQPHSDIDLLASVHAAPLAPVRLALMQDLLRISAPPGNGGPWRPLEVTVLVRGAVVPWRHPAWRELQFGEWLRDELATGIAEPACVDPDLAILLTKARQHSLALLGPAAADCFDPVPARDLAQALRDTLALWNSAEDWAGEERNIVLALARIWFSAATGRIASKDAAADWALARLPPPYRPVLATARDAYLGRAADDLAARPQEVAAFVHHLKAAASGEKPRT